MQSRHSKGHLKNRIIEIEALVQILQQSSTMRLGFQANSFEFAGNPYFIVAEASSTNVAPSRGFSSLGVEACSVERYVFQLRSHALLKVFKKILSLNTSAYSCQRVSCEIHGLDNRTCYEN